MKRHITWLYFKIGIFSFSGLWPSRDYGRLPFLETTWSWQKWIHQLKNTGNDISNVCMSKKTSWPLAAFNLKNVPPPPKVPCNCGLLAKKGGRYLRKWEKEPLRPLSYMWFGGHRQPPNVLGRPTGIQRPQKHIKKTYNMAIFSKLILSDIFSGL